MATTSQYYRAINRSYGHTDQKEHQNITAFTGNGFVKGYWYVAGTGNVTELDENEGATLSFTVTDNGGPQLGDAVSEISASVDLQDLTVTGQVSTSQTVELRVNNVGASSLDLASCTWRFKVTDYT